MAVKLLRALLLHSAIGKIHIKNLNFERMILHPNMKNLAKNNKLHLGIFQLLLVIGNIIGNYRYLCQEAFIRETILMAVCSNSSNRRFCLTLEKTAVLFH